MKSNMVGMIDVYTKMFEAIRNWCEESHSGDEHADYLVNLEWTIGDAPHHGWIGKGGKNERKVFKKVSNAYYLFLKSLAEVIGYEYDLESTTYKYYLKDLDTDCLLDGRIYMEGEHNED